MPNFGRDDESGAISSRGCEDVLVAIEANMDNIENQQADSVYTFVEITSLDHKMKAALYEGDSPYSLLAQTAEEVVPVGVASWIKFDFSSPPALVANKKYWITVWSEETGGSAAVKYSAWSELMRMIYKYSVYAANFPNPFPANPTISSVDPCIYCAYSPVVQNYPVNRLKKDIVSGFNCFMNAYLSAKVGGFKPLKLPDGTPF